MITLFKNIFFMAFRQIFTALIGLLLVVLIARFYGPEGNGLFAVALLLPSTLIHILNLGIPSSNVYFIGKNPNLTKEIFILNFWITLLSCILGFVIGVILIVFFHDFIFPDIDYYLLWIALFSFPLGLIQNTISSLIHALEKFHLYNILLIFHPISLTTAILFLIFLKETEIKYLVGSQIISYIVTILISLFWIRKFYFDNKKNLQFQGLSKQLFKFGIKSHLSNLVSFINYKIDIFLTNLLLGPVAVGIYVIAVGLSERLWIFSHSASTVIYPRLTRMSGDESERKSLTPLISRWVFFITLIFACISFFVIEFLVQFFFGSEYLEASLVYLFLLPGVLFLSCSRILSNDIASRGKPEYNLYISLVVLFVGVIGNLIFIPIFKLEGAACATSISYFFHLLLTAKAYNKFSNNTFFDSLLIQYSDLIYIKKLILKQFILFTNKA